MSPVAQILLPVFIQVALTFALLFRLGPARVGAIRTGEVKVKDVALGQQAWPDRITQLSNSYNNQFQLPVLFYVLVIVAIITRKVDPVLVYAAWTFVVLRIAHAFVHVTSNHLRQRFYSFLAGVLVLLAAWAWLAFRIIVEA
jgi:hypothetical protein